MVIACFCGSQKRKMAPFFVANREVRLAVLRPADSSATILP